MRGRRANGFAELRGDSARAATQRFSQRYGTTVRGRCSAVFAALRDHGMRAALCRFSRGPQYAGGALPVFARGRLSPGYQMKWAGGVPTASPDCGTGNERPRPRLRYAMSLVVQISNAAPVVDTEALRRELEAKLEGEVRFDAVSRALYSTDASVYQIHPLGVVVPKNRDDILRALEICRRLRCSITMRGGGTSQAGQAIGPGIQIDVSKYLNRVLEVNAREQWVRVEPGIVLDELNAQLQPLGMRFAPDISTASRATVGGMMANNSSGARSVLYGKTIDHVLEQVVALSDGSIVHFREIPRSDVPSGDSLEATCYRTVLRLASEHAAEIDRRYPKIMRRVGGYNLDEFTAPQKPVNMARIMVGSEGTLGIVLEAKLRLVPLPKAKAVMVVMFGDLLESLAAAP